MPISLENVVGQKLMWSFQGHTPPPDFLAALHAGQVSGVYTTDAADTPFAEISWRGFVAKVKALAVR